jgi:hypothetical protein
MNVNDMMKAAERRQFAKRVTRKALAKAKLEQSMRGESDDWAAKRTKKLARRKLSRG